MIVFGSGPLGGDQVIGWSPHEWDWCPYRETSKSSLPLPLCEGRMRRQSPMNLKAYSHQRPNLPTPWSWIFQPPELWVINVYCLSHPVSGFLFIATKWLRHHLFIPGTLHKERTYFKKKGVISSICFSVKENENQKPYYLMFEVPADSSEDSS